MDNQELILDSSLSIYILSAKAFFAEISLPETSQTKTSAADIN